MENTWIIVLATIVAVFFLEVIIVVLYDPNKRPKLSSFLDKVLEKTKGFVTNRRVWKVFGTGVGLGVLVTGIVVLGYYAWHWISNWGSGVTAKPTEGAVASRWYNMPIVWVGAVFVGVACFLALLVFLQKRLKPGNAEVKVAEVEKKDDKDKKDDKKDDKDVKKDPATKKKEDGKEEDSFSHAKTWYGQTIIYTVMVIGFYLLATWLTLSYLRPKLWEWLWVKNQLIFFFIPGTILLTVLAIKFRHLVVVGFALFMVGILSWSIMDESGGSDWLEKWYSNSGRVEIKKIETAPVLPIPCEIYWELPAGVEGAKEFPTSSGPAGQDGYIVQDGPAAARIEVNYTHNTVPMTAVMRWNRISDPDHGEWNQPEPANGGKWRIRPDPSGDGYRGEFTRSDTGPNTWISMRIVPVKKPS